MSSVDGNPEIVMSIEDYPFLPLRYVDMEIAPRDAIMVRKKESRARHSADEEEVVAEQSPAKIPHMAPPIDPISQIDKKKTFSELVKSMDMVALDDFHRGLVKKLMVQDPKRGALVPSRFCSFHLAGFDLDEESTAPLGQVYEPNLLMPRKWATEYVTAEEHFHMSHLSFNVISLRVVKVGPNCTYPVKVYGKVIARDEVDHKCVYLFNREMKDAQVIRSKNDMLALTGPYRALVTLGYMYFEFDLKIKDENDAEVQFSQGVITYFYNAFDKRIILQLPSFQSTVKLVLQHVPLPVAASIEVNVLNQGQDATVAHYDGKITAGTSKDYRQHMVLYDSSVPSSGGMVGGNGSLALYRNLISVKGYAEDPGEEEQALHVCFLDAGCEIEDEDFQWPPEEDEEDDDEEDQEQDDDEEPEQEQDEDEEDQEQDEEEQKQEDPKNVVTLGYPRRETVLEYGSCKLEVKVKWTVVHEKPQHTDFFHRYSELPEDCNPNYRFGGFFKGA